MSRPIESDPASLVDELREQQRQQWSRGEPLLVETLLESHPQLRDEEECLAELLYAEFLLREQLGDAPQADEYFQRFPDHEPRLQRLFEVHRALADEPATSQERTFDTALASSVDTPTEG